jgi:curved DNA-binding protein CbpA
MTAAPPRDYYAILGITPDATTRQVKTAYRKLVKTSHPDACIGDPHAAERFRLITEACEVLSDPQRRKEYDRTYVPPPDAGLTVLDTSHGTASVLLAVLESCWRAIRYHHPELPPVVLIIASASGRWHAEGIRHAEVMISGEGLRRTPAEVLATLLHEAAHALAHARDIRDTSRQGRYHNKNSAWTSPSPPPSAGPAPPWPTLPPPGTSTSSPASRPP